MVAVLVLGVVIIVVGVCVGGSGRDCVRVGGYCGIW